MYGGMFGTEGVIVVQSFFYIFVEEKSSLLLEFLESIGMLENFIFGMLLSI